MLRVIMFDLGLTLIDENNQPFPHVKEALTAIQGMVTSGAKPLQTCLVSDFTMPAPPPTPAKIKTLFNEYLQILDSTGLRPFFEPVQKRITLSSDAGALKPDRRVFTTALQRLGSIAKLSECLFITENAAHIKAAHKQLKMQTLQFRAAGSAKFDFDDWSQAPLLIAHLLPPHAAVNTEAALKTHLTAAHGLDIDSVESSTKPGKLRLQGKLWHPVTSPDLGDLSGVMVKIPVEAEVTLGTKGNVRNLQIKPPSEEQVTEATAFVKSLARHQQLTGQPGTLAPGATHQIEVDEQGRRRLVRRRYSAM